MPSAASTNGGTRTTRSTRGEVNGPFMGVNQFAVQHTYETTFKPTGERRRFTEMALYTVENGKIVREHFFYSV
jgi:SnoaL-like domain